MHLFFLTVKEKQFFMKSIGDIILNSKLPTKEKEADTQNKAIKTKKKKKGVSSPPSNLIVFQHNNLIEANYKLTLQEKRIIMWLISQIKPTDEDFKKHTISTKDFCDLIGIETDYSYIHKTIEKLMEKVMSIKKLDTNSVMMVHWVGYAEYWINEGKIEMSCHPEMTPFLLELKSKFTAISLSDLMKFNSIYAVRVYELLKQYETIGERIIELTSMRKMLGIENKLKQYKEFKETVLLMAQREINVKSDIEIKFEEIKTGRKITKIKFIIKKNLRNQITEDVESVEIKRPPPVFFTLEEFGISKKIIHGIIKNNKEQDILNAVKAVEIQLAKGGVKNPIAMLLTAIKERWHPDIYKAK